MRRLVFAAMVALIGVMPMAVAQAQPQAQAMTRAATDVAYPLWIGFGAITGVTAFNLWLFGLEAFPFLTGVIRPGVAVSAQAQMALARFYAVVSGVTGALIADAAYMSGKR
ncbi:conserved membrane hypothetical protein [uncultured Gammaproteobacteria bacterium]